MNWEQYRTMLSSAPTFPTSSPSSMLNRPLSHQRHGYLPELKSATASGLLYQHPYLPYLTPRAKEFQPTVVTRPTELNLKEEIISSPASSSPRSCTTEGSTSNSVMLHSPNSRHLCQVCGDSASGVHYGVQTCEGCKSFFKRSLQGKGQSFVCAADNKCQVDKRLRRNCAACRLRVCHQVGMKSNGVRKRKLDKSEKVPSKVFKIETVDQQLELRNLSTISSIHQRPQSPIHLHQLPLSPVSLASPPSSPDPSEGSPRSSVSSTPSAIEEASKKSNQDLYVFAQQIMSQLDSKHTIGIETEDYESLDRNIPTGTALCQLFQHEIPNVVHWARTIPDYKSLPIEDQIYLTRNKCLDLLVMSVISQSCVNSQNTNSSSIHFSLSEQQYKEIAAEQETPQTSTDTLRENILKAAVTPLKTYASETFFSIRKAITHYQHIDASQLELEILKLLMFTNTDANMESNINQASLLHKMRNSFRAHLRSLCVDRCGAELGERRYNELLLSLTMIKELSTRLECCMTQQSEVMNTLNSIYDMLP